MPVDIKKELKAFRKVQIAGATFKKGFAKGVGKYGPLQLLVDGTTDSSVSTLPSSRHKLGNHGFTTEVPTAAAFLKLF